MVPPTGSDRLRCSLLLFLATSTEKEGLVAAAKLQDIPCDSFKHPTIGSCYWLGRIGYETVIAVPPSRVGGRVVMGSHGRLGTAARGIRFQEATAASGIIQLGMAFGVNPEEQSLGDVLVSSELIPYDNRIVKRNVDGPPGYVVDYRDANREPARESLIKLFDDEAKRNHPFKVYLGAMLSGNARIQSASFRDELVSKVPPGKDLIVGGEMEGVGLLAASTSADDPVWCVVKGISDFADGNDAMIAEHRQAACLNAAVFVLSALQNRLPR